MPRNLSAELQMLVAGPVLTLANYCKITRLDGAILGFTSFDRDLTLDGVTFEAFSSVSASAVRQSEGTGVDNLDIVGLVTSTKIRDTDILAGLYDGAAVELGQVNYLAPQDGVIVHLTGTLGEITEREGEYTAEIRSLSQRLAQQVGALTSATCRVRALGDTECQVSLGPFSITAITQATNGQITTATAHGYLVGNVIYIHAVGGMTLLNDSLATVLTVPTATTLTINVNTTLAGAYTSGGQIGFRFSKTVSSVSSPLTVAFGNMNANANFFRYGRVQFTSGLNAGFAREIKSHSNASGSAVLTLQESFPFSVSPGDAATLEAGCDRTAGICTSRFGNLINVASEPYVPGNFKLISRGRR